MGSVIPLDRSERVLDQFFALLRPEENTLTSISGSIVLAVKAYGKWAFREYLADHNADFCISPKKNEAAPWFCDWWLYKERHLVELVETFFLKLKEFRCVATSFDELARRFLGFVHLACFRILLA